MQPTRSTPEPTSQPLDSSGSLPFHHPLAYFPPQASSFKDNSNIFLFNAPLYFSISGSSFELKPSKSRKLSSFLTNTLSTLAKTAEPNLKPDLHFDGASERVDGQSDLLPAFDPTKIGFEPRTSDGLTSSAIDDPLPAERRSDLMAGLESASKEGLKPTSSGTEEAASPQSQVSESSKGDAQIDPRIQLADFFRTAQRYWLFENQTKNEMPLV